MSRQGPFSGGSKRASQKLNRQRRDIDTVRGYNLLGDGIIKLSRTLVGTAIRLDVNALKRRLAHGRGGLVPHLAFAADDAGFGSSIEMYLDVDTTGELVTVECEIVGGSNLNAAIPRLEDGTMVVIWNNNGTWRPFFPFQATTDC